MWAAPAARALDPSVPLAALHHDSWTAKNGAPGEVSALAQTRDGWLWVGTAEGLFRFDGIRFRRFEPQPGDAAPRPLVTALTALQDGGLLIGYLRGGVALLKDGRLRGFPTMGPDGKPLGPVFSTVIDTDGALWMATTRGLLRLDGARWTNAGAALGLGAGATSNLMLDQYGQLWVAEGRKLYVKKRGAVRFVPVLDGVDAVNLIASPDGRLWADTHERLVPVPPQHEGPVRPVPDWLARANGQENGLFDRDGNYWSLGCPVGICRVAGVGAGPARELRPNAGPRERLDQPWQLNSTTTNVLFEDRDGNLWVGSQAGLERFRHNRVQAVALQGGERVFSFANAPDGSLLALATPTGTMWKLTAQGAQALPERLPPGPMGALANATDGALLVALPDAIERRTAAGVERIAYPAMPDGARPWTQRIVDDGTALWIRVGRVGLFRRDAAGWRGEAELGLPPAATVSERGKPGEMWFGYDGGVIVHYAAGRVTRYALATGTGLGAITYLHVGEHVIAAGDSGMAILSGGRFRYLSAADPDVLANVSGMVVVPNGDRYFNGKRGIVHVTAADWRASVAQPEVPLRYTLLGALDGYPGAAATIGRQPTAVAGPDGQLWFAASTGLARVDLTRPEPRPAPPRVRIETLVARRERHVDLPEHLALPAGTSSFRIEYTALSYRTPETVRFRYRLQGVDADWQEAGTRRAVSYTNVGPGTYRFEVEAEDELGQRDTAPAALTVDIPPTFTQSRWFAVLGALLAGGAVYLLYRLRLRQATQRIAERLAERERIARALHDSFLQSVQGLVLTFHAALSELPAGSPSRAKLERAMLLAERVIEEGRDEVQRLRSPDGPEGDVGAALAQVGAVLQEGHDARFALHVEGERTALRGPLNCEVYHIGREALINAFRHAGARHVVATLDYGADAFVLRIADDGRGLPPEVALSGRRSGHWGIPGMHERAERAGGTLRLYGGDGGGTVVELTVPRTAAYEDAGWRLPRLWPAAQGAR
ncbi:two component regulator with propeller domain [Pseudoduganella flava]|nr:two component regulator with propeller domain [Pseudoduganella flava]